MRNFFDQGANLQFKERLAHLRPDSVREWGRMTPAQVLAHLSKGMELVLGDIRPPRMLLGRVIGGFIKPKALGDDAPMRRNSPTVPGFVIQDERDFVLERERLTSLMDRAAAGGASGCTTHPHSFFGHLTPEQWGILMYKHLDHHLRQFGV